VLHALFRQWWAHEEAWGINGNGTMESTYLIATFVISERHFALDETI
jgi:hypothetical protein